jgi:hypothetical protein
MATIAHVEGRHVLDGTMCLRINGPSSECAIRIRVARQSVHIWLSASGWQLASQKILFWRRIQISEGAHRI